MKNFDFNRFNQTLRWTLMSERSSIKATAIACGFGAMGIQLFFTFSFTNPLEAPTPLMTTLGMKVCAVAFSFLFSFFASRICSNVRSARQRATALMLPASKSEKFLSRVVFCIVLLPLLALLCIVLATCVRLLFELLAGHHSISIGADTFFGSLGYDSFMGFVSSMWFISLFMLAGVFFRRVPFLWMLGIIVTGGMLLGVIISMLTFATNGRILSTMANLEPLLIALMVLFTVFNVWLSYKLYLKLQIVQNKVFNV